MINHKLIIIIFKINSFIKDSSNDSQENKEIKSDILKVLQRFRTENLEKITNLRLKTIIIIFPKNIVNYK